MRNHGKFADLVDWCIFIHTFWVFKVWQVFFSGDTAKLSKFGG